MSVIDVAQKWSGQTSSFSMDNHGNSRFGYRSIWTLKTDSPLSANYDALNSTLLPAVGSYYMGTGAICVNKTVATIGPFLYEITCDFQGDSNPLYANYERSWSFAKSTEPIDVDSAGNAILNPNGERYTGLTKEVCDLVYVVTRNETSTDMATHLTYQGAVNSDTFKGYAAKKCRLVEVAAQEQIDGSNWYWRVTYRFQFRQQDDWRQRILVEGHKHYTGTVSGVRQYQPFYTDSSETVVDQNPHPLASTGARLADETNIASHVWVYKDIYPLMAFSGLSIT